MYTIQVDRVKKLVNVRMAGFAKVDEMSACASELQQAVRQFGPKQAVLLVDLTDFRAASADVVPLQTQMINSASETMRKVAVVNSSIAAQVLAKRTGQASSPIQTFAKAEDALKYLLS